MTDVFVSYAREDFPLVEPLATALTRAGLTVFLDRNSIPPGDKFPEVIAEALHESKAVLSAWTPRALGRPWVLHECRTALEARKLVPIVVVGVSQPQIPEDLRAVNYIDYTEVHSEWGKSAWSRTIAALEVKLNRPISSTMSPMFCAGWSAFKQKKQADVDELFGLVSNLMLGIRAYWSLNPNELQRVAKVLSSLEKSSSDMPNATLLRDVITQRLPIYDLDEAQRAIVDKFIRTGIFW